LAVRVLLMAWLALCVLAGTAAAECGITTYTYTPSTTYGQTNTAAPEIPYCWTADPINCATGNLAENQVDLSVQGHGPPLQIVRYYNSQLAATQTAAGSLGYGWTSTYSAHLTFAYEKTLVTVHHDNGSSTNFEQEEAGGPYEAPVWTPQASLSKSGENYIYTQPDHTKLEFNSNGRLLKVSNRHGLYLTLSYNTSGQLESVTDQAARKLTFTYNTSGQIEKVTDPMGRVVKYAYSAGHLASTTLPGSETPRWKFGYNTSHELTTLTNGRGYSTTTTYDASHRAITQTDPLGRKYTFAYKENNGVDETTITEPNGAITLEKFNEAGSPTSITHAYGTALAATSTYTYNSAFLVTSATDPNGHVTTYTYDSRGNRLSEKDPNGNEAKWAYSTSNDVVSITDPAGHLTKIGRNATGDPTVIQRLIGTTNQETKLEYNEYGDLLKTTDPIGRVTRYTYDTSLGHRGLPLAEYKGLTGSEEVVRSWGYNTDGEVTQEIDGRGYEAGNEQAQFTTKISRDAQGRPIVTTDPLGNTTKVSYDLNGNVGSVTDGNGHTTTYVYDSADQRTEVKVATGATRKTTFDSMGSVASNINANGKTTEYKHDLLGRTTEVIDPLGRKTTRQYSLGGNLTKEVDAEARSIIFSYDSGDRNTKIDYSDPGTADVSFVYDKNSNIVEMVDGTGTTKRVYDGADRLVEVANGNNELVKYEYNLGEDIAKIVYPNGKAVTRGFDKFGRLEKVVDWLGKETKFSYFRDGLPRATTFPSEAGNVDEYSYDARGGLAKTTMKKGAEVLASLTFTRDKVGQLTATVQKGVPGGETLGYEYDAGNRLVKGDGSSYEYDLAGNPIKEASGAWSESFTYDAASQLVSATERAFTYNKVGQRVKYTPTEATPYTYAYDQAGNLTSVQRSGEFNNPINETYKYDGSGLRVSESVAGTAYPMVWDSTSGIPTLLSDGRNRFIYGPEGLPIEQISLQEVPMFFHHDAQGSTRLLTGSTGKVEAQYNFGPYGAYRTHSGTADTLLGYRGEHRSPTSGLIYMRARVYDPNTYQFLSVDPMVADSGEPYSYAADNPVNLADPAGLMADLACGCCPPVQQDATAVAPRFDSLPVNTIEPLDWYRYPEVQKTIGFLEMASVILTLGEDAPLLLFLEASTGRTAALNVTEQMAMRAAMSDPAAGRPLAKVILGDKRWPAEEGWVKYHWESKFGDAHIHYNYNTKTGATADWKFK